jgi:hypothetical protein
MEGPGCIPWGTELKVGEEKEPKDPGNPPEAKGMEPVGMEEGIGGTAGTSGKANCVKSGAEDCGAAEVFFCGPRFCMP